MSTDSMTLVEEKANLATDLRATSKALYSEASRDWDEREEVIPWLRLFARQASDAAAEIERLELAVSDMQMSYNNCASNADALRDQRDEARRENERLVRALSNASGRFLDIAGGRCYQPKLHAKTGAEEIRPFLDAARAALKQDETT